MSIDEFWELSPKEVALVAKVKNSQLEEEMQRTAWAVAHIISYTGRLKRPITPDKLLPKKKKQVKDTKQEWQAIKRMFEG